MKIANLLLRELCAVFSLVWCASIAGTTLAQPYPNKPIRIIVASTSGGGTDQVTRVVGQNLASAFGQPMIIDNRGGAAGNIAAELAAKASPDGYTLLMVPASYAINPSLYRISYDPVKDFAPVTQVATGPYVLAVHPSVPVKTVKELIALAKSKKGGITYSSPGGGSASQLGMELLRTLAAFDAVHVPYKGGAPAVVALIAGEAEALISTMPSGLPHVRSGRIRAIAVTGLKRSVLLPDVPTVAESGFPGYEIVGWYGLLAPADTPREVVAKLYKEISRILKLPDVRDHLSREGAEPVGSTPEEFAAYIKVEMIKYGKTIKQSGAKVD